MLTTPITNDHFHSRVLNLLGSYNQAVSESPQAQPLPLVPALENIDTPLTPSDTISQLLAFTSSWIDLGSPDPVIAHLSRQVFHLEIAYAAFCGVVTVVVPGPRLSHGSSAISQYARAVKEALSTAGYIQLHILMPMKGTKTTNEDVDLGHLARFVSPTHDAGSKSISKKPSLFGAWDAWNTIRSICRYPNRLSVGKEAPPHATSS
jgi:protein arginine N-methyltransferase 5